MDEKHFHNISTRLLPKTGQVTSYLPFDDGDLETGWWRGKLNANNRTRFRVLGVLTIYDRATDLMWPKNWSSVGGNNGVALSWADANLWASNLVYNNYSDWRIPNINELLSIINYVNIPAIHNIFLNIPGASGHWSSTTYAFTGTILNAWYAAFTDGGYSWWLDKTNLLNVIAVRSMHR